MTRFRRDFIYLKITYTFKMSVSQIVAFYRFSVGKVLQCIAKECFTSSFNSEYKNFLNSEETDLLIPYDLLYFLLTLKVRKALLSYLVTPEH